MERVAGGLHFRHIFVAQVYSSITDLTYLDYLIECMSV